MCARRRHLSNKLCGKRWSSRKGNRWKGARTQLWSLFSTRPPKQGIRLPTPRRLTRWLIKPSQATASSSGVPATGLPIAQGTTPTATLTVIVPLTLESRAAILNERVYVPIPAQAADQGRRQAIGLCANRAMTYMSGLRSGPRWSEAKAGAYVAENGQAVVFIVHWKWSFLARLSKRVKGFFRVGTPSPTDSARSR